ncbi:MarR family transcriptional regulator [Microbacterium betulae]|uniref:MarR family transcriptional regulator n=1 Tax=Microbacterium betulae TaxID=2981139 RepID=A0AA97FF35_9MICO|nr:MarR family transcriptional regulator [Microbacterium sp. AB]WOF21983.1 MarR family transcriptional regulator [Microbacterium sp. AB]
MTHNPSGSAPASGEAGAEPSARPADLVLDASMAAWIESFASVWEVQQGRRMDGRVLGLLIIGDAPYLSSTDIARLLDASAGAVSMSTRALSQVGFIARHTVPGDRRHFYRVEDDVWGAFLLGERAYLRRMADVFRTGMQLEAGRSAGPRTRLRNADRYMRWLEDYHRKMVADWRAYRDMPDEAEGQDRP